MADTITGADVQGLSPQKPQTLDNQNPPTQGPVNPNIAKQGSGFVNLSRVMEANRGSNLGQALGTQSQNIAQGVQGNIQQAGQAYQNVAGQAFQPYAGGQQFIQNTIQNPTGSLQSDVDRFKTITAGNYNGPTELGNQADLQSRVSGLQDQATLSQSANGRQALLGTLFSAPQYGLGERRLDSALLQQDPAQAAALAQIRGNAAQTTRQFTDASQYAQNDAALKARQAQALGASATQQLGSAQAGAQQQGLNTLAAAQSNEANLQAQNAATTEAIKTGALSAADMSRLGLSDLTNKNIYNLNLGDYLKTTTAQTPTSAADVITQQQAAQANALARLGGQGNVYNDPTKVGTYNPSTQTFDIAGFQKAQAEDASKVAQLQKDQRNLTWADELANPGKFNYGDTSNAMQDMVNTYGSLDAARAALGTGNAENMNHEYMRTQILERYNALKGLNTDRQLQQLPNT